MPKQQAGILVDEQFGANILRDATKHGYITACPTEKSGQDEFDFEYGEEFGRHIETFRPTFCKVLVRYNPEGDPAMNRRQSDRLKRLSDYLHPVARAGSCSSCLCPLRAAARAVGREKEGVRSRVAARAHDTGHPRAARRGHRARCLEDRGPGSVRRLCTRRRRRAARRPGRVGCIILGRGEDDSKVREWLKTAAGVDGFIGFAVGRTSFWEPLSEWKDGRIARDAAVSEIARRYQAWVGIFEAARTGQGAVSRGGGA